MGNFFTAVKRGFQTMGEAPAGDRYSVAGKAVRCAHCAHEQFVEGRAQLNTAGMTFLNLDWANRQAATLTCTRCGRIEWFLADPQEIGG
jgi:predicted nucleic-acid-binding Zn-ribbon protein